MARQLFGLPAEAVGRLTGGPTLEPEDVIQLHEDPDSRPYIWDLEE